MTITYQGIKADSRTANNDSKIRTYSNVHLLTSDSKLDTAGMVGEHTSLPLIGQPHARDGLAYCNGISVRCVSGYTGWEVTDSWTTENSIDGETGKNEDPLQDRHIVTWGGSQRNQSIYKDRDGNGIQNSAGDPLLDTMEMNDMGVTVASNVDQVPSYILSYRNSINSGAITVGGLSIAAGVARLVFPPGFITPVQSRNGHQFYTFSFQLILDEQFSHTGQLLDQGYNERFTDENTTDRMKPITLTDQQEPREPVLLDGAGGWLENPTPATASYITVNRYFQKDFTVLPGVS